MQKGAIKMIMKLEQLFNKKYWVTPASFTYFLSKGVFGQHNPCYEYCEKGKKCFLFLDFWKAHETDKKFKADIFLKSIHFITGLLIEFTQVHEISY